MRCYARTPLVGLTALPQTFWLDVGERRGRGKGGEREREGGKGGEREKKRK